MTRKIFVNLPVKDLKRSIDFFTVLGFSFNPRFTNDTSACMVISDTIFAMLLTHKKFREFTRKEISDATKTTEVLLALEVESKEKVDELAAKAQRSGGMIHNKPQDYGWMYMHGFADPDGHQWELLFIDETAAPKG